MAIKYTYAAGDRPLDGYVIHAPLGRGGFGEVYKALSDGGKEVALKHVQANLEVELRGVRHCLNLKHPNLLALYDMRQTPGEDWWVVMEYVSGESLDQALQKYPNGMPYDLAMQWLEGICQGVQYLHDNGLVHRDMKPGNVFLDNGIVKVGDYGLSKFITASRRSGQTGSIGTVHYMAPEVSKGRYGKEIDLYSIGVMLYELLTGNVPFDGETAGEVLMKHLTAEPDLSPLPANVRPIVGRLLRKDPAERYSRPAEVLRDLGIVPPAVPTPSMWRGEVDEPRMVIPPNVPNQPRQIPFVLPANEPPFKLQWWKRVLIAIPLTGGLVLVVGGILTGMFRFRGDTVAILGTGLGFLAAGLIMLTLRSWAYRRGFDRPAWLVRNVPIGKLAALEWVLVSVMLGVGSGLWLGGVVSSLFRRMEEEAALMGVGLGHLVLITTLLLQTIEVRRLRRSRGTSAPSGLWPTLLRFGLALFCGTGCGLFIGGLVSLLSRSEEFGVVLGLGVGGVVFGLMLFGLGLRLVSMLAIGVCWAGMVGTLCGIAFDGIVRDEDAAVAVGFGVGILTLAMVLFITIWFHQRRKRWHSSHPGTLVPPLGAILLGQTSPWSPPAR